MRFYRRVGLDRLVEPFIETIIQPTISDAVDKLAPIAPAAEFVFKLIEADLSATNGPAKPKDLRSLEEHYHPKRRSIFALDHRPQTITLLLSIYLLHKLWAQDFTSMSVYWVARLPTEVGPHGRSRLWSYGAAGVVGLILLILLVLLLLGKI